MSARHTITRSRSRPYSRSPLGVAALAVACALAFAASPAAASNLGFLKKSAVAQFKESDYRLMLEAAEQVLASAEPDASQAWLNEDTRNSGEVRLLSAFRSQDGRTCKRIRVLTRAGERTGASRHVVCRAADGGEWRLDPRARP